MRTDVELILYGKGKPAIFVDSDVYPVKEEFVEIAFRFYYRLFYCFLRSSRERKNNTYRGEYGIGQNFIFLKTEQKFVWGGNEKNVEICRNLISGCRIPVVQMELFSWRNLLPKKRLTKFVRLLT
jgi:hypothetical protein